MIKIISCVGFNLGHFSINFFLILTFHTCIEYILIFSPITLCCPPSLPFNTLLCPRILPLTFMLFSFFKKTHWVKIMFLAWSWVEDYLSWNGQFIGGHTFLVLTTVILFLNCFLPSDNIWLPAIAHWAQRHYVFFFSLCSFWSYFSYFFLFWLYLSTLWFSFFYCT